MIFSQVRFSRLNDNPAINIELGVVRSSAVGNENDLQYRASLSRNADRLLILFRNL
jgi:hypothetical protein